ncbi:aminotransferase [Aliisedimentitalea scapharcae]|uniref:aspartate transaminase n=1 Tax=Aliisedimentitalea scapharcae TaxID=1524259 RepID=A0ABZ2XYB3_9RHOB
MTIPRTHSTFVSPIVESRRWVQNADFPADRPLINVSQAAPIDPPPLPLRQAIARAAIDTDDSHLYGPVLGRPALRAALAGQMSDHYDAHIHSDQIAITSGCNQAFAATIAALCSDGDEIIIPTPWYFNHKMWLDMSGVAAIALSTGPDMVPDPAHAAALITKRTRAIALVSPNNPCGVEYPAPVIRAFYDLAKSNGIKLILDETYRDFDSRDGAPHDLFTSPEWDNTLIHLYSFSKAYRLTGHRVGAIATAPGLLYEMEKFLDTVTICPNQLGQIAATWGIENLSEWVAGERVEILDRRSAIADHFPVLEAQGWKLLGLGAYFAYVEHPFDMSSLDMAQRLVNEASVLMLPGTMFMPDDDPGGKRQFRIAFANIDRDGIAQLFDRLANLGF